MTYTYDTCAERRETYVVYVGSHEHCRFPSMYLAKRAADELRANTFEIVTVECELMPMAQPAPRTKAQQPPISATVDLRAFAMAYLFATYRPIV
jgi:hypothetical protein